MAQYILKRLLLMIPTLLGILLVSFAIVQFVPGGPVEKMIAELQGHGSSATSRFSGGSGGDFGSASLAPTLSRNWKHFTASINPRMSGFSSCSAIT